VLLQSCQIISVPLVFRWFLAPWSTMFRWVVAWRTAPGR
jgi:hypothetical protein